MKNIAVFFGGRSAEHDVSIITGTQLIENADKSRYTITPVYISREGKWFSGDPLKSATFFKNFSADAKGVEEVFLSPVCGDRTLWKQTRFGLKPHAVIDVAVLAMHGMHGEDGTLQGLLELTDIPYTSAGVTGSAAGMDKILMKAAFAGLGFPILDYCWFLRDDIERDAAAVAKNAEEKLGYPMIVKPANLGSSIGISIAKDNGSLVNALNIAAGFDRRIVVEKAVTNMTEINCAVLGRGGDLTVSVCEKPIAWNEFLSFDDKYLRGSGASKGMKSTSREIPANIPEEQTKRIQQLSAEVFRAFDLKGVVRIDYIIDNDTNTLYINEANTIPGSFAFYLFEPLGIPFARLIDTLIENAEKQWHDKNKSTFAFESDVLKNAGRTGKLTK